MIPLFKTQNGSIGRSILVLDDPASLTPEEADSVFALAKDGGLKTIVFVEDTMAAFPEAEKSCKKFGFELIYGLRLSVRNSDKEEDVSSDHKVVVFAKNGKGAAYLNQVYSAAFAESGGFLTYNILSKLWNDNLILAVPFYDSFLFKNTMTFASIVPNFNFAAPIFLLEDNDLPFDQIIRQKVAAFCADNKYETWEVKSIFYSKRVDAPAFLTYKMICLDKFSKEKSLAKPNFDHFCSTEFCFEAWKEKNV